VEDQQAANARLIQSPFSRVDDTIDGVGVTWLSTPNTTRRGRLILYLHAGAYIYGSARGYSIAMLGLANQTGMRILAVNYRLAPETPFPGGMEDVKTVYRWLLQRGYAPEHIVVMGESAGGGLALSALLSLRDEGAPMPAALVALSPWADLTRTGDTEETLAPHSSLCWETDLAAAAKAYTAGQDPHNPLISPVYAQYAGMPPMLLYAGTREILLSDAIRVNHQALAAGVPATLDIWEGMFHMFAHFGLPESREALANITAYILHHIK
jgi:acetyl esterase/lipase